MEEFLMKQLKTLGLAAVLALVVVACIGATSASATTICVGGAVTAPCTDGHPGGAVVLTSSNGVLQVHGGGTVQCTDSTISGTAPATSAASLSIPATLAFANCTAFLFPATVTVGEPCHTAATQPRLDVTWNQAAAPQASATVTLPVGCHITVDIPAISCTLTVTGGQTIGNGGAGAGGIAWTNGTASAKSSAHVNNALLPDVHSSGGGFGCPSAGTHSGTLAGTYSVVTPAAAPGVTVIQ
jgi:hypothetical protein